MADPQGFLKYPRQTPPARPPRERVRDFRELYGPFPEEKTREQAARCMDCGIPFCHSGCPLGNLIPEFNHAVHEEDWQRAFELLSSTNNFPEFTGRICPAPCEAACVLGINQPPVAIEHIEQRIVEHAFEQGWLRPNPPVLRSGRTVAVVGSGPAGLAAADQLNKRGHSVTVFERADRIGGLLRYGIPDFKLEKRVLERRLQLLEAEGVRFRSGVHVGKDLSGEELLHTFDAVLLCTGATVPRNLDLPGRELRGVHFAMEFLEQQNRRVAGQVIPAAEALRAEGKDVVVIGGGDTGADCVGTSNRQGARSVTQLEILPMPPTERDPDTWPLWPFILRTSTSHEEGCTREWAVLTKAFLDDGRGQVRALRIAEVEWSKDPETGRYQMREKAGTERELPCQLALIAAGFLHPEGEGLLEQLGVARTERGTILDSGYATNVEGVFAAGDARRGQSLVVWAIAEGRQAARAVHAYLQKRKP